MPGNWHEQPASTSDKRDDLTSGGDTMRRVIARASVMECGSPLPLFRTKARQIPRINEAETIRR
jgi:hypothetical protein